MEAVLFSIYAGLIAVIIVPVLLVLTVFDTYRQSTRRERLQLFQVAVLVGTTGLATWTVLWAEPTKDSMLFATTPLWVFCGIGAALSIALGLAQWRLTWQRRQREARLTEAFLRHR